jgi:hypothetical protein
MFIDNYAVFMRGLTYVYLLRFAGHGRNPGPAIGRRVITNCVRFLLSGLKADALRTMRDGEARMVA